MLLTVVPGVAAQEPQELMRNHQLSGPLDKLRSTDLSDSSTVVVRVAVGMVKDSAAMWSPSSQSLSG